MRYRLLGRSGLRVSELFLGAMTFGEDSSWGADREESARILDAFLGAGGNVLDTAVNYRGGESERILGDLLVDRRDDIVLATKYTISRNGQDPNAAGNHRKNLRLSLETSLRRLKTDYIDLYYVHIWDRNTPIEETMRALDDAVSAGKVLHVGISDAPAWVVAQANTLADWRGWTPFVALQIRYSLVTRDAERELIPVADALGLSVAAWGPLAGGLLSGKFRSGLTPRAGTRVSAASISTRDQAIADAVGDIAGKIGASSAQVAIAWTMSRSRLVHPILGATSAVQLLDNLGALDLEVPPELLQELDDATQFQIGFPGDFIAETRGFVYGDAGTEVERRRSGLRD